MIVVRALAAAALSGAMCVFALTCVKASAAAESAEFTDHLCIAQPEMLAFSDTLSSATARTLAAKHKTLAVDVLRRAARPTSVSVHSCRIFPKDETLQAVGAIEAAYIVAFEDVVAYRERHPPTRGVSADSSQVDVVFSRHGPYVIVSLADNYVHRDSSGRALLGCAGTEYYRVETLASQVLPFDGCVER